jgi:hypothetical protein
MRLFAVAVSVKYSFTCGSRNMNEPEIEEIEQVCKIDPPLNGSTLEKIHYGKSYDLSVRITKVGPYRRDGHPQPPYSAGAEPMLPTDPAAD